MATALSRAGILVWRNRVFRASVERCVLSDNRYLGPRQIELEAYLDNGRMLASLLGSDPPVSMFDELYRDRLLLLLEDTEIWFAGHSTEQRFWPNQHPWVEITGSVLAVRPRTIR